MTDGYMKDCCKVVEHAVNRLEQLERALDGLDLFLDVWDGNGPKDLKTITTTGQLDTLYDVEGAAQTYLDGFRAALGLEAPTETPKELKNPAKPDAAVSAANAAQPAVSSADGAMPERMNFWYGSETTDHE